MEQKNILERDSEKGEGKQRMEGGGMKGRMQRESRNNIFFPSSPFPSLSSLILLFFQQIFIEYLLGSRHWGRHWGF